MLVNVVGVSVVRLVVDKPIQLSVEKVPKFVCIVEVEPFKTGIVTE